MEPTILDNIPFTPDQPALMKRLRVKPGGPNEAEVNAMLAEARAIARPKGVYKISFIEGREDDRVMIDGITFTSRVLSGNLEGLHRVFAFAATCGVELDAWAHGFGDMLKRYWADAIAEAALRNAINCVETTLTGLYVPSEASQPADGQGTQLAEMNPGSLEDWPINEQAQLFRLLGEGGARIGVQLTETFLMNPVKSVSGIYFLSQDGYANCQLCPREVCSNRKAAYDAALFEQKYARIKTGQ